jgi:hypothetical protein
MVVQRKIACAAKRIPSVAQFQPGKEQRLPQNKMLFSVAQPVDLKH